MLQKHLGIQGIEGECRPGLVAVQGALASALDRNWTNLALFITRTPPFGDDVDRFPPEVEKFAEQNGWAGARPCDLMTLGFYFANSSLCSPSPEMCVVQVAAEKYLCS
jgi:hypothetical protein